MRKLRAIELTAVFFYSDVLSFCITYLKKFHLNKYKVNIYNTLEQKHFYQIYSWIKNKCKNKDKVKKKFNKKVYKYVLNHSDAYFTSYIHTCYRLEMYTDYGITSNF